MQVKRSSREYERLLRRIGPEDKELADRMRAEPVEEGMAGYLLDQVERVIRVGQPEDLKNAVDSDHRRIEMALVGCLGKPAKPTAQAMATEVEVVLGELDQPDTLRRERVVEVSKIGKEADPVVKLILCPYSRTIAAKRVDYRRQPDKTDPRFPHFTGNTWQPNPSHYHTEEIPASRLRVVIGQSK
ncbi:MAG: hypothetical protein JW991_04835 [Candidatus Pacebacteria bacterium]|nr:hypothetical protein [Candidatus Paceibacterota bacterium]